MQYAVSPMRSAKKRVSMDTDEPQEYHRRKRENNGACTRISRIVVIYGNFRLRLRYHFDWQASWKFGVDPFPDRFEDSIIRRFFAQI
jgi:hypothetical protein